MKRSQVIGMVVAPALVCVVGAVIAVWIAVGAIHEAERQAFETSGQPGAARATCDGVVDFDAAGALAEARYFFDQPDQQALLRYAAPQQRAFLVQYAAEAWFLTTLAAQYHDEPTLDAPEFYQRAFQLPPMPGAATPTGLLASLDAILAGMPAWETTSCERQWLDDPVTAQDLYAVALDVWRAHALCLPPNGEPPPASCQAIQLAQAQAEAGVGTYAELRARYEARRTQQPQLSWVDFLSTTVFWPR